MKYASLGRTGAQVSRLALGTMNFGWQADEPTSRSIMDGALDVGINFFDTADVYNGRCLSEEHPRPMVRRGPEPPDRVLLATKLYIPHRGLAELPGAVGTAHPQGRARTASAGCRRTTSTSTSSTTSTERTLGVWEATETARARPGKVVYVGSSNFAGWHLGRGPGGGAERGTRWAWSPSSPLYNLMERDRRAGGAAGRPALRGSVCCRGAPWPVGCWRAPAAKGAQRAGPTRRRQCAAGPPERACRRIAGQP